MSPWTSNDAEILDHDMLVIKSCICFILRSFLETLRAEHSKPVMLGRQRES